MEKEEGKRGEKKNKGRDKEKRRMKENWIGNDPQGKQRRRAAGLPPGTTAVPDPRQSLATRTGLVPEYVSA